MKKILLLSAVFILFCSLMVPVNEAQLKFMNKSKRYVTVKIMKGTERKSTFHQEAEIDPKSEHVFSFTETGKYYVKTMAIKNPGDGNSNDTIYTMGKPFQVIADERKGYTRIKMNFKVKESRRAMSAGMKSISRGKFFEN